MLHDTDDRGIKKTVKVCLAWPSCIFFSRRMGVLWTKGLLRGTFLWVVSVFIFLRRGFFSFEFFSAFFIGTSVFPSCGFFIYKGKVFH